MTTPLILRNAILPAETAPAVEPSSTDPHRFQTRKALIVFQPVEKVLPKLDGPVLAWA